MNKNSTIYAAALSLGQSHPSSAHRLAPENIDAFVREAQKYVPIVAKVLDGRKTATFFQLDRRIAMMLELQVSSQMPLVQDQGEESSIKGAN